MVARSAGTSRWAEPVTSMKLSWTCAAAACRAVVAGEAGRRGVASAARVWPTAGEHATSAMAAIRLVMGLVFMGFLRDLGAPTGGARVRRHTLI
jgi:hypothetical protein